jgi:hypothetical protein
LLIYAEGISPNQAISVNLPSSAKRSFQNL